MARAWVYDRNNRVDYREAVIKAKKEKREPPKRWQVLYLDKAGKQRSETFRTQAQANIRRTELEDSLLSGTFIAPNLAKEKFEIRAGKWIDTRHDVAPSTWWNYRYLLDSYVLPEWTGVGLGAIDRERVEEWVAKLHKPENDGGMGLGPSMVRGIYRVFSMVLEWCVPKYLVRNPAKGVALPIRPEQEHVYLTYAQIERLADAAGSLTTKYGKPMAGARVNRALILLLAYTGMRWGEAASLKTGRVDLDNRRVRVATTFYEINGVQHVGKPKGGKPRTVAIPASLVPVFQPLIEGRGDDEFVFTSTRGKTLRAHNWRHREFRAAVAEADLGVEGLTPHKLRHTAASLSIAAGADVKVIQQMLGHADATMTLNTYGHLWPDRLDEVANALDARRKTALTDQQGTV